jgi:hypothetical protein
LNPKKLSKFEKAIDDILIGTIADLNAEVEEIGEQFDYKGDLKSNQKVKALTHKLETSFQKDVKRKKAKSLSEMMCAPSKKKS